MTSILSVRELTVGFRRGKAITDAIHGVSFELSSGGTVGILGGPGCGKTVLSLALLGILPRSGRVTGGEVVLEGIDLLKLPAARLREIRGRDLALVTQDPRSSLNPVLRIGRQIDESLRKHLGVDKARARSQTIRLLERVGLSDAVERVDDYPHHFTDEERQRIAIAMAIACRPRVLIADDPTSGLDPTARAPILRLLRELVAEQGMDLILLTRDAKVVEEVCDRMFVMEAGRLVEPGEGVTPDDLDDDGAVRGGGG